ncbi:MAG: aldo/keto reductase [Spirochaetota bacterium]
MLPSLPNRRQFLRSVAVISALAFVKPSSLLSAKQGTARKRAIPSSGEQLPVIGMGTWITFNVGQNRELLDNCKDIMQAFFQEGGRIIDSSPMYGSSQDTIGYGYEKLDRPDSLFAADKVWTRSTSGGKEQITESAEEWKVQHFDLLQVHNLVNWRSHLKTLFAMKERGEVRYVGITTSHGRRHGEMERIMRNEPIDFVQFSYNAVNRKAEDRLLPLAQDKGLAVIINRPFRQSALIDHVKRHPLPGWAGEIECANWAQVLLKYIVSHEAVTCTIPATSQKAHLHENMGALHGILPDAAMRKRIVRHVEGL